MKASDMPSVTDYVQQKAEEHEVRFCFRLTSKFIVCKHDQI